MNTLEYVMLYVNNQEEIAKFWIEALGFVEENREDYGESYAIVLSDGRENGTKLVLQNKEFVAKNSPGLNLETPSILLTTTLDIAELYQTMKNNNVTVGDLVDFPTGKKVFNFADPEGNYFAIIEA